jgi:SAM-dependent methyltransferase
VSPWIWIVLGLVFAGGLAYWLLIVTEGTFLGARVVTLLYDGFATRYDRTKGLRYVYESYFLGMPIARALSGVPHARVLDVATGTGRLPLALAREASFDGKIVGIDRSRRMLAVAQEALDDLSEEVTLLQQDAARLGFVDASFDGVVCLEALEFMERPRGAIDEMLRVLRPGGLLVLSNRVGFEARLFPGRLRGRGRLERHLGEIGLQDVRMQRWQVHYDLVWARKPPAHRDISRHTEGTQMS